MEVLLINHSLYTGGVETLMVRMANWLVRNGHGCGLMLRDSFPGDLTSLLDPRVRKVIAGNWWDWLVVPGIGTTVWESWNLPRPDFIYTFEKNWSVIGLMIRDLFKRNPPAVATGAYHLNQFAYEYTPKREGRLNILHKEIYDRFYPDSAKFFMSEETKIGHERYFGRPIADGWIWPLPIEIPGDDTVAARTPVPRRILSIGRLTLFKTYSWYMVPILHRLREKYPEVQWHVHGFGLCERELVDQVWKQAIADGLIVFHGPVEYQKIGDVFSQASVFVGMGTTILEAAAAGVPTIPAVVDDKDAVSWGFIDSLPYYSVGETVPGKEPVAEVEDLLERFFAADDAEVVRIAKAGRAYVEEYSMDHLMTRFLDHANKLHAGPELTVGMKLRYLWIRSLKLLRNLRLAATHLGGPPARHPGGDRVMH
ncbi:MAG: glycosyltransferase family 4 protein [Verrucomicrobiota bacterium]